MKTIKILAILTFVLLLGVSAQAQKRKKTTTTKPKTTTVSTANEIKEGAEKVSIQLKNTAKFLYFLGGVARGMEDIDKDIKSGKIPRNSPIIQKNETYKQNILESIKGLRTGLIQLESDFRVKLKLKPYLIYIQGLTEISGTAEEQAMNGEFTNSGKTLLIVIEKLTDTLAALPAS